MKKKNAAMIFMAVLLSALIVVPTIALATEETPLPDTQPESLQQSSLPTVPAPDAAEIYTMDNPEILFVELGSEWAGREFKLKTDLGEFTGTIKADENGVLETELGGSKTYTLSAVSPADPVASSHPEPAQTEAGQSSEKNNEVQNADSEIPTYHMVLFFGGLAACSAILIGMRVAKAKRYTRESYDDDDE